MKYQRVMLLSCLSILMMLWLTGCSCLHSHGGWHFDTENHWYVCDKCGEEIQKESHDWEKGNQCKTCKIYTYPDEGNRFRVESYDEKGAISYVGFYDVDGSLETYQRFENTYFDNGIIESVKAFGFDRETDEEGTEAPLWENHYLPYEDSEDGAIYLHLDVLYEFDGTKITREYNQAGELVKEERS